MRPLAGGVATLGIAVVSMAAGVTIAAAQGGSALPAYGEPTIINSPGLRQVFTADFTRDGISDFATVNAATVTVYPGLGDGTFGAGMTSSGCATWNQALLGDFNGDGTPDIAFREYPDVIGNSDPAGVMFGTGAGTFQPYRRVGALPYETTAAAGDFDGDGRTDLAGVGNWGGSLIDPTEPVYNGIAFLWGRPDGSFDQSGLVLDLGTSRVGHTLFTADLTGDGTPDLVWKKYLQGKFVVMPGLGGRTFGVPIDHTSAGEPTRFAAADFNADGMRDLAVLYSGGIGILNGNGDGTFQPVTALGPWSHGGVNGTSRLLAWDFNGDTKPDLSIDAAEGVALFTNNGDGTFRRCALTAGVTEPHNYDSPYDYAVADFNSDGRPDFVVAWTDGKAGVYIGLAAITTALAASSPSSIVGQPVTLTATVTPSNLTGPVTFYDGLHALGSAPLSGDQAALTTTMLSPGAHALRAAYGGTLMGVPSTLSSPISHPVTALPARSYLTSFDMTFASHDLMPHGLGVADLNRDGSIDLVAADYWWDDTFGFFAGRGDGTLVPWICDS